MDDELNPSLKQALDSFWQEHKDDLTGAGVAVAVALVEAVQRAPRYLRVFADLTKPRS
jgi:hypothetical protein